MPQGPEVKPEKLSLNNGKDLSCKVDPIQDQKLAYIIAYRAKQQWDSETRALTTREEKHALGDKLNEKFLSPIREIVFFRDKEGRKLDDSGCIVLRQLIELGEKNADVKKLINSNKELPKEIEAIIDTALKSGALEDKRLLWGRLGISGDLFNKFGYPEKK